MSLSSRQIFRSSASLAVLVALIALAGCEPEFTDHICESDNDCFADEQCVAERCVMASDLDVGPDADEPDADEPDADEPDADEPDVELNECGGTEVLENSEGDVCGPCDLDQFECVGEELVCSGSTECPDLDIITTNPTDIGPTSATLNGQIQEFPFDSTLDEVGFCWGTEEELSLDDTCEALDEVPDETGAFSLLVEDLAPGTRYFVRAYSIDTNEVEEYANEVEFLTEAPGTALTTENTLDAVLLTWDMADGATGYELFADGDSLEVIDDGAVDTFDDDTAPAGVVAAPLSVDATDSRSDGIRITWDASVESDGAEIDYTIVVHYPDTESDASDPESGQRLAPEVTGYEVLVDADWIPVGDVTEYLDDDAPRIPTTPGAVTASKGDHVDYVLLTTQSPTFGDPEEATYSVRATFGDANELHSPTSQTATGQRGLGTGVTYQWQRTTGDVDEEADYEPLGAPTTSTTLEDDSPELADGSPRFYRVEVSAPGAETELSNSDDGWRDVAVLEAPQNLQATGDEDKITLSWDSVTDATGYDIYRDGDFLINVGDDTTTYDDESGLPEPALPGPPVSVEATVNDSAAVTITWDAATTNDGADVEYTVRALFNGDESADSNTATGNLIAPAIASYEISIGDESNYQATDTNGSHEDNTAPAPTIEFTNVTASDDIMEHVELNIDDASTSAGDSVTYFVRAVDTDGRTSTAESATGNRADGTLVLRWQFNNAGTWTTILDEITPGVEQFDTDAPDDGTPREYRVNGIIDGVADTEDSSNPVTGSKTTE